MFHVPNEYRVKHGLLGTGDHHGNNGVFYLPSEEGAYIRCIVSDGGGWEHVSACFVDDNLEEQTPHWEEMCYVKDMFWDEEDCVVQFHPPKSEYINNHEHVLHLWRPVGQDVIRPPKFMI